METFSGEKSTDRVHYFFVSFIVLSFHLAGLVQVGADSDILHEIDQDSWPYSGIALRSCPFEPTCPGWNLPCGSTTYTPESLQSKLYSEEQPLHTILKLVPSQTIPQN